MATRDASARRADGAPTPGAPLDLSHPLSTPVESADHQQRLRRAHEAQYGRFARWLRRVAGVPQMIYEFADSVDLRVRGIFQDQQAQDRAIQELTQVANTAVTAINSIRGEYEDLVRRVEWYEQQVPQLRRAKEDFDRLEAERLIAERTRDRAMRPPVIPFDPNGVRSRADAPPNDPAP